MAIFFVMDVQKFTPRPTTSGLNRLKPGERSGRPHKADGHRFICRKASRDSGNGSKENGYLAAILLLPSS
jgi:hypothetical protein